MDWVTDNLPMVVYGIVIIISIAAFVVAVWRRFNQSDQTGVLLDLVADVLDVLRNFGEETLGNFSEEEVRTAAFDVYDILIGAGPLSKFVTRTAFIELVIERWRILCQLDETAKGAIMTMRLAALPRPDTEA